MKQFINCGQSILLFFLFFSACGTPLNDYNPKNEKEKEIKIILVQFTEYRNNFDVKPGFCTHTAIAANARVFFRFGTNCRSYSGATVSGDAEKILE
jgi:hypothetical protein